MYIGEIRIHLKILVSSLTHSLSLLPGQSLLSSLRNVAFSKPPAGFDKLDPINKLFASHDGKRDGCKNPGNGTVHLVCSVKFGVSFHNRDIMKKAAECMVPFV